MTTASLESSGLIEECCFNFPRDYCSLPRQPCACGCHERGSVQSASVDYRTSDWDRHIREGTVATHTVRIPELGNAELKLTVDVERIQTSLQQHEALADAPAALPAFAQLRPIRVEIYLGGEHVYHWTRDSALIEEPERVKTYALASGDGTGAHPLPSAADPSMQQQTGGATPASRRR